MDLIEDGGSEFEEVRSDAMKKGYLVKEDLFRMYRAIVSDTEQLERDLAHISKFRPDAKVNPDCSLEWARVLENKPDGYDEWAERTQAYSIP